jgi:hypothetical protein
MKQALIYFPARAGPEEPFAPERDVASLLLPASSHVECQAVVAQVEEGIACGIGRVGAHLLGIGQGQGPLNVIPPVCLSIAANRDQKPPCVDGSPAGSASERCQGEVLARLVAIVVVQVEHVGMVRPQGLEAGVIERVGRLAREVEVAGIGGARSWSVPRRRRDGMLKRLFLKMRRELLKVAPAVPLPGRVQEPRLRLATAEFALLGVRQVARPRDAEQAVDVMGALGAERRLDPSTEGFGGRAILRARLDRIGEEPNRLNAVARVDDEGR